MSCAGSVRSAARFVEMLGVPPVLVVHGTGGGFDQALMAARGPVGIGYRVIAPSRFGYLRSPMPADASHAAQPALRPGRRRAALPGRSRHPGAPQAAGRWVLPGRRLPTATALILNSGGHILIGQEDQILVMFVCATFAGYVHSRILDSGDQAATANNIRAQLIGWWAFLGRGSQPEHSPPEGRIASITPRGGGPGPVGPSCG